jgi:tripeptidyl-peptidase-1
MIGFPLVIVVAIAALSQAAPAPNKHVLHEKRQSPSSDWIRGARIEDNAILPMRIGLTQNNLEKGHDLLMEVYVLRYYLLWKLSANLTCSSDSDSPKFGQHWSQEDIHDMFAPSESAVQAVRQWLADSGIDSSRVVHSDNKGWLAFDATAEEAEALLLAKYYEHAHVHSPNIRVGCDEYDPLKQV